MPTTLEDIGGVPHGDKLKAFLTQSFGDEGFPLPLAVPSKSGSIIWTLDPRLFTAVGAMGAANDARGSRVIIPRTGTITSLSLFVATASGNVDVGVYSASGTNRTKIASAGSTANAGTNAWQTFAVSAPVNAGDVVDLVCSYDNNTATFARLGAAASALCALPTGYDTDLVGSDVITWAKGSSFPLPGSFATVNAAAAIGGTPLLVAKLVPTN